jgi:hypothetical protein
MLSLVMFGRRAQADWRGGNGHGSDRPLGGRSRGDLDELARATRGFRVTRVDKAKNLGSSSSIGHEPEPYEGGGVRRFLEIKAVTSLAVTVAADRRQPRADYHSLATSLSLPDIDINA